MRGLLIILVILPIFGYAQSYMPTLVDGREWKVVKPLGMGAFETHYYHTNCDTNLNGKNYFITRRNSGSLLGYLREDTLLGQIYKLDLGTMIEDTIIDFSLQAGDTIYYINSFYDIVDSVNTQFIFQKMRKVIHINSATKYIEGIGSGNYGVEPDVIPMFCVLNSVSQYAQCGQFWPTDTQDLDRYFGIYPNPTKGLLQIEINKTLQSQTLKIYSITGQLLINTVLKQFIDVSSLNPGVYFLSISGYQPVKFIKE